MPSTVKEKMLYIMGIDWNWIYQRPQILAEKLDRDYDVTVVFPRKIFICPPVSEHKTSVKKRWLPVLPLQEKNRFIGKISQWIYRKLLWDYQEYEYIYVGYPVYACYIPPDYKGCIIYDCIDNHQAMLTAPERIQKVTEQERNLIHRCQLLFASSNELRKKVNLIAGYDKAVLVRNGVSISASVPVKSCEIKETYEIGYIGTVAEWFNYKLLIDSAEKNDHIRYHLIGPVLTLPVKNTSIFYEGVLAHDRLAAAVRNYDCLVMPFLVNEIVSAVDPVKLYEYISFGKCIISVYYPELEHFRDFVYFYRTKKEYLELLDHLYKTGFPAKYNEEQRAEFLAVNDWETRYHTLKNYIQGWRKGYNRIK